MRFDWEEEFEEDIKQMEFNIDQALERHSLYPEEYSSPFLTFLNSMKHYINVYKSSKQENDNV